MPYIEDFQGWSVADPWTRAGGGTVSSVAGLSGTGVSVTEDTLTLNITTSTNDYTNAWFQVYTKPVAANGVPDDSAWTGVSGAIYVKNDGTLWASGESESSPGNNEWTQLASGLPTGQWLGFVVHMDYSSGRYTVYRRTTASVGEAFTRCGSVNMRVGRSSEFTGVLLNTIGAQAGLFDEVAVSPGPAGAERSQYSALTVRHNETRTAGVWTPYRLMESTTDPYDPLPALDQTLGGFTGDDLKGGLIPSVTIGAGDKLRIWSNGENGWPEGYIVYELRPFGWVCRTPGGPAPDAVALVAGQGVWIESAAGTPRTGFYSTEMDPKGIPVQPDPPPITLYGANDGQGWTHRVWTMASSSLQTVLHNGNTNPDFADGDVAYVVDPSGFTSERRYYSQSLGGWAKSGSLNSPTVPAGCELWIKRVATSTATWNP